ncbi:transglycosylase SLT domain-containing protein [Pedosphaera parvula]|uniref:Uncharacterized protein n=1 Tax=Pedosphaera parvula (strain Ellin514) TaxID=320771 RepID=B9XDK8_PEDPL|nr:transglycosylase SLT domain-containing protein [Pedosphaera parvula]EEF62154.1 hypothetical protein Cflav_PD6429 [Pedosphaera parvula Ellin514]
MRLKPFPQIELRRSTSLALAMVCLTLPNLLRAEGDPSAAVSAPPPAGIPADSAPIRSPEDLAREKAIAEFTQRMKDANYPALFEKAASEFGVPTDVLAGIAFAETRWEHLQWPPGETVSPETGMPRPYGIMSLWDNEYFGHSLLDAAKLIGKDPQELKDDPYQNMRGAAALLKQLYSETPKPADAPGDEIESWRKAIVKYSGIPQPELSEQHGLEVYEYMNDGYHQYGIEWEKHPVKLEAMRAEVAKIKADAQALALAKEKEQEAKAAASNPSLKVANKSQSSALESKPAVAATEAVPASQLKQRWILVSVILGLLAVGAIYIFTRKPQSRPRK